MSLGPSRPDRYEQAPPDHWDLALRATGRRGAPSQVGLLGNDFASDSRTLRRACALKRIRGP